MNMSKKPASLADLSLKKTPVTSQPPTSGALEEDDAPRRKGQTLRLSEGAHKQLKYLSVERGIPAHDLLIEAVNDLFRKYGKPPIA
jgi:hypothetical protein